VGKTSTIGRAGTFLRSIFSSEKLATSSNLSANTDVETQRKQKHALGDNRVNQDLSSLCSKLFEIRPGVPEPTRGGTLP
jgi:hypothetical protein